MDTYQQPGFLVFEVNQNRSATQSFQVKSGFKWLYWSYSAYHWRSATRVRAWDALLLLQKSAVCMGLSVR